MSDNTFMHYRNVGFCPWMWMPAIFFLLLGLFMALGQLNKNLFVEFNLIAANIDYLYWPHVTNLGDGLMTSMLVFPFIRKKPDMIWAFLIGILFTTLLCHGVKEITAVARPPAVLSQDIFNIIGPAYTKRSFPSGHSATIATVGCILVYGVQNHWAKSGFMFLVVISGFSRIALGIHWPVDVAIGISLGWVCGILGLSIIQSITFKRKYDRHILFLLFSFATVIGVLIYRTPYEGTAWSQITWIILFSMIGTKEFYHYKALKQIQPSDLKNLKSGSMIPSNFKSEQ